MRIDVRKHTALKLLIPLISVFVLTACEQASKPGAPGGKGGKRPPSSVVLGTVEERFLVDEIEVIGTLQAYESVTVSATVTDNVSTVNFSDGQFVEKDDILVTLTDDEQSAELAEARANLDDSLRRLNRLESIGKNLASESDIDLARSEVGANRGRLQAIEARLDDRIIRAPFSGVLGFREVSVGALVTPGSEITTLDDIKTLKLDFTVPEVYLAQVQPGNLVAGRTPAWPDREISGRVATLGSRVDPVTRAIAVRADIPNSDYQLRPGMLVNVTLYSDQYLGLVITESALVQVGNRSSVYVVDEENTAHQQSVTIIKRIPGHVVVGDGVKAGDRVVIDGTLNLRNGVKVKVIGDEHSSFSNSNVDGVESDGKS
ncbi:efflux RND transporter periplasmic adaptor subunit [Sessilibacter corallicola]|uniref:Efflux RND transporter periplasmic adaptor subunit n=1 Tax=Sessilibacter corallicola TaxID=2904075 RepID=A0ABQ0AC24_9GAMM